MRSFQNSGTQAVSLIGIGMGWLPEDDLILYEQTLPEGRRQSSLQAQFDLKREIPVRQRQVLTGMGQNSTLSRKSCDTSHKGG